MIDYIKDMFVIGSKITTFPYTMKGPIAIVSKDGKQKRCPAWGTGKTIVKVDKDYVYVQSDVKGKFDLFNAHGDKVEQISAEELK